MAGIVLEGVEAWRRSRPVLRGIDLTVRDGEVLAVVGSDAAALSLILDLAGGREEPDAGNVLIGDTPLLQLSPDRRPELVRGDEPVHTSAKLVGSALVEAAAAAEAGASGRLRVEEVARQLALSHLLRRRVGALTVAERWRVALALALLRQPQAVLLDQPTRGLAGPEGAAMLRDAGTALSDPAVTMVYATTDGEEAMRIGDRLAFVSDGRVQQVATPAQIAENPVSFEVLEFVGGERLIAEQGELSSRYLDLPAGRMPRPEHVPSPAGGPQRIVYAAWPRATKEAVKTRTAIPSSRHVQAAVPGFVFDARTGERLDRAERPQVTVPLGERRPRVTPARSLNIVLARRRGRVIDPSRDIAASAEYELRLWIGNRDKNSIVANAAEHAFPDLLLPKSMTGHRLQVVAYSAEVRILRPVRQLLVPAHGESRRISFGLRTPDEPGEGNVRVGLWYRRHLLQSALIDLTWGSNRRPSHAARIDYTVSDLDDVARFPERDLSLVVNETAGGVHRLIVNGHAEQPFGVTLYEANMTTALTLARKGLLEAHRDPSSGKTLYDADNGKSRDAFITDLTYLAHKGAVLLEVAFANRQKRNALVRRLREASAERDGHAVVQIAQAAGSKLDFPWHLVYDIGLETLTHKTERPCRVLDLWRPHADPSAIPSRCPYETEHKLNTICPFGFWGFAHIVELPPSTLDPSTPLPLCVRTGMLTGPIAVAVSRRLDPKLTACHLARLPASLPHDECVARADLEAAMAESERELIYFYCHGDRKLLAALEEPAPVLEIGEDDYIATGDIAAWASIEGDWPPEHWEATKPLIFINGCHTAEVTPVQAADFVSAFMGAGAAGIVGTEIMLDQRVASEAAEELLAALVGVGSTVGSALQTMRRILLAKGNVMGLAYTAYCSASLALSCKGS